ncbi:MAG: WD40 repeat domain-containing protein [Gemmatales bacterium]|nr:WD40 repeat domain-containing protein [Gemmatales bacterium]MDW7994591.1 WD40 repeat domain-containing protein [Gemmatales bacterium]
MRWLRLFPGTGILTLFVCLVPSYAGKMRFFQQYQAGHYEKAQLQGVVVAHDGSIRLGRPIQPWVTLEASHIWSLVEDKQGRLLVATGNEGKVYRVDADGNAHLLYRAEDPQVFSLAATPDGRIFAGTGPNGLILEITAEGKGRVIAKTGESYVWSLVYDSAHDVLYAGTGPRGKILRLSRTGQVETFYATKQEHVQALVLAEGRLYASTAKRGIVYRFDLKNGQGQALFETPHNDIRTLALQGEVILAGTAVPLGKTGTATSPPAGTAGVKENVVYAIHSDGSVREALRERAMIMALVPWDNRSLIVATAGQGQVFELDSAHQSRWELVRLEYPQVTAACRRRDGSVVFACGEPGRLFLMQPGYLREGTLVSDILDMRQVSRLRRVSWTATLPQGTCLRLALRTGNTTIPDETWTAWSSEITDPDRPLPEIAPGRFAQYRLTLTTEVPYRTPIVHRISLGYKNVNLAPELTALEVPDWENPSADATKGETSRKLRFRWSANDPNEDTLVFDVYFRKEGWPHWVELARDLEKPELEWDTSTVPSGVYRLKVIASDRRDNSETEAREAERISTPFVVDNQPPQVSVRLEKWDGDFAWLSVQASDQWTRLIQASYSLNGGKWQALFPSDGIFDQRSESFRFRVGPLRKGTHVVVVRISDAAGNLGAMDLVFEKE